MVASEWTGRRRRRRFIAVTLIVVGLGARLGSALSCVGDCKGEGKVDLTDLILGVDIVLGVQAVTRARPSQIRMARLTLSSSSKA
jgi:hypothetical protein